MWRTRPTSWTAWWKVLVTEFLPRPSVGSPWHEQADEMATGVRAVAHRAVPGASRCCWRGRRHPGGARGPPRRAQRCGRSGSVPEADVARTSGCSPRWCSVAAISEAAGRFRHHDPAVIDEDFAELLDGCAGISPCPDGAPPERRESAVYDACFSAQRNTEEPGVSPGLSRNCDQGDSFPRVGHGGSRKAGAVGDLEARRLRPSRSGRGLGRA